jgi:tetratricopeptide (TPR) repeat protein
VGVLWQACHGASLYGRGLDYRNGHYKDSLALLKRSYKIDPNDASVLTLMGWNDLKMGRPEQALKRFSRAHWLSPDSPDTILGYADTETARGRYQHALELLRQLKKQMGDSADLAMAWGSLYRHMGRDCDAAREFERVQALRRNDELALKNLRQI